MDVETKALLHFVVITIVWIVLPLVPAWLTYKITPNQVLGLRGPFQGMTLNSTGSFAAYVIVGLILSTFIWPTGKVLLGRVMGDTTWHITGAVELYDANGERVTLVPQMSKASINIIPNPNTVSGTLSLMVPFIKDEKPTVYIDVPNWGGAVVSFQDPETYVVDPLNKTIRLKNSIQIRQQPQGKLVIGEGS
ncbi:hypothetical protein [Cupriavidus lacunae]|uniref:Uncharacterized protein n=1 Tax=Cupriavidus lacunae TaxID=2666307 RepID=A0A370MY64_9BURK|nr:hypothetical protein [Cupriavidus lacunae]RDJ98262.1 hypothetical protein DN412_41250 [Cupriavidus lacunae]